MNGYKVWFTRLRADWNYQKKILLSIMDWTVLLYVFLPALLLLSKFYLSWWEVQPIWLDQVPLLFYFIVCYFLSLGGEIRLFMEDADQLYLLQHRRKVFQLRRGGTAYSILMISLKWGFLALLLLPLTHHLIQFSLINYSLYIVYMFSHNLFFTAWRQEIYAYKLIKKMGIYFALILSTGGLTYFLLTRNDYVLLITFSVIYLLISWIKLSRYIEQYQSFFFDVEKEQKCKMRFSTFIFTVNPEIHMPQVKKTPKSTSFLWRYSQRIFHKRTPINGVTEMFIKSFFRDKSTLLNYVRVVFTTGGLIALTPIWLKWIICIAFWLFFKQWFALLFEEKVQKNPYLLIAYRKKGDMFLAQKKCESLFILPGVGPLLLLTIVMTFFQL
ncbi:ABC transporter permease [Metabacillus sp. HB246100]